MESYIGVKTQTFAVTIILKISKNRTALDGIRGKVYDERESEFFISILDPHRKTRLPR